MRRRILMKMTPLASVITTLAVSTFIAVYSAKADTFRTRSGVIYTVDSKLGSFLLRGYQAEGRHDYTSAISFYTAALKAGPEARITAAIYNMRGQVYLWNRDLERALQDANESIRLEPTLVDGYEIRGLVYRRKGECDRAIDQYNSAIRLKPDSVQLYVDRGVAYSDKGEEQRAISDYNEAIRRNPNQTDAYVDRGVSYDALKQFDKALADYNKVIRLDPAGGKDATTYLNRATLFQEMGDFDRAIRDCNEYIHRRPRDPMAYSNRGHTFSAKREYKRALADLETAERLEPSNPKYLNNVAWLRATCIDDSTRSGKEAVQEALEACRLAGWANAKYLDTLAAAYAEAGEFEKAVEYERRALERKPPANDPRPEYKARLSLYQTHKPFRDVPGKK